MGYQELIVAKQLPLISQEQLQQLCRTKEIVLYEGLVLDVSSFVHPGGHLIIKQFTDGQPLHKQFNESDHSLNAKRMIRYYAIGRTCQQSEANSTLEKLLDCEQMKLHQHLQGRLKLNEPILTQVRSFTHEELVCLLKYPTFLEDDQQIRLHIEDHQDKLRKRDFWQNMILCWTYVTILEILTLYHSTTQELLLTLLNYLTGLLVWTLIEYYFHRFLLHQEQQPGKDDPNKFAQIIDGHGIHHAFPRYRPVIVINPRKIVLYSIGIFGTLFWIVSLRATLAILTGIITGLTCYDALHYWMHFGWRTNFAPLLKLQRSHLKHHYKDASRGFGVSSTLWDHVFGTTHI